MVACLFSPMSESVVSVVEQLNQMHVCVAIVHVRGIRVGLRWGKKYFKTQTV